MHYSRLKAIPFSFFSKGLYQDVARNWKGVGYSYLLLVLFLVISLFAAIQVVYLYRLDTHATVKSIYKEALLDNNVTFDDAVNSLLNMVAQIPSISVHMGEVSIDAPQPYTITEPISEKPVVIFDTTGKYTNLQHTDALLLVTKNAVIAKKKDKTEQVKYFSPGKPEDEAILNRNLKLVAQLPLITLKEGKASSEVTQPFFIKDPDSGETVGVVDTTDSYKSLEDAKTPFLITSSHLYYDIPMAGGKKEIALSDVNETNALDLAGRGFQKVATTYIPVLILIAIPFIVFFLFIYMMFVTLFLAVIGKIIAWISGAKNLAFSDVIRLACVAVTPAFIIAFFAHLGIGIGFLIALGYLIFAVTVNRNTPLTNE